MDNGGMKRINAVMFWFSPILVACSSAKEPTVVFRIDAGKPIGVISPYIYGTNQPDWNGVSRYMTLVRQGGNRMTAYNWTDNASNAGADWHHQNDSFLGGGEKPGEVVRSFLAGALGHGCAAIVTVPMAGYVSADKKGDGDVNQTPDYLNVRFRKSLPRKGEPFAYPPSLKGPVYQDEFAWWVMRQRKAQQPPVFFDLDNEPDIWASTHARIVLKQPSYAEFLERSMDYAKALKSVAPSALIFGPVSYGWGGYATFQGASDAGGRFFLEYYLQEFKKAEDKTGKRMLDVLDVHWYPEAQGGGKRITERDASPAIVAARLQAPRSLWDPKYMEDSWITNDAIKEPIRLLPRLNQMIEKSYPGTKLAITEYNYGGGQDISGALAEADVLGIFGRYGVYAASIWGGEKEDPFVYAGVAMYRNFDGKGGRFGDQALPVTNPDPAGFSVYASSARAGKEIVLVAINKKATAQSVRVTLNGAGKISGAKAYVLAGKSTEPQAGSSLDLTLPAMSVTTVRVKG
jgi:hypothetical protein